MTFMDFQGFQSSFSTIAILSVIAILICLALYSYHKQKSLPVGSRWLLGTLRAITLTIIALLIFNPVFFKSELVEREPKLLVLFDNSESLAIEKGDYRGIQSINELLTELAFETRTEASIDFFSFGNDTRPVLSPDSLRFSESQTNFTEAITQIEELQDDYNVAIIISDGIITIGRNPLIQAAGLGIPVFTIATGDTSAVRDVTINNILTNNTGYTESNHIVEVEVSQNGFSGSETVLTIFDGQKNAVTSEELSFSASEEVQTIQLELPLKEEGLQAFQVQIEALDEEWSTENNTRTFSIDVLDSKTRVLHIASEIHPDVKAIRSLLLSDPSYELSTLTWLGGNSFVETESPNVDDLDLIVLHGMVQGDWLPNQEELITQTPTLYIELPRTRRNSVERLPIRLLNNQGAQIFELNIIPNANNEDHPILEVSEVNYDALAPILTSLRATVNGVDITSLLNTQFQNMVTPNTVLAIADRGNSRRAHIAAWGWHRLFQSTNETERLFAEELFLNTITWASNNPDERLLTITPSKSVFNSSESVIINASLVNESGESESDAAIEFHLIDESGNDRVFNMTNNGAGRYSIQFESLSNGLYSFSATARKGSRTLDEQTGEFLVEDSSSELINTVRNDPFLNSLALESEGSFFIYNQIQNFWETLRDKGTLTSTEELVEAYIHPIRSIFWFVLVILLLGAEWLLRKNYSLP
ncbi:MAG: hypothetical protein JJ966_06435 [Balneolaceae bacterium]|nr:hypothetical protein [Balneolaceae bacterium]